MTPPTVHDFTVTTDDGFALHGHVSGRGSRVLLGLHGGPGGYGADYMAGLHLLAGDHRRVVTFDQLGTGNSQVPPPMYSWSMARAAADVDSVRRHLGVETADVLGHSYGGMLALQYALSFPTRVGRLVLSSTGASTPRLEEVFRAQVAAVASAEDAAAAMRADDERRHDDPVFLTVMVDWLARFFTNGDLVANESLAAEALDSGPAGRGLWGRSLWTSDGAMEHWDVEGRLAEIEASTLVVHGGHDTSGPEANRVLAAGITGCEWITLNNNGHGMFDEPNYRTYLSIVRAFLDAWPTCEEQT